MTDPAKKQISLVFTAHDRDDGAQFITSTLKKLGVKASFFFTGEYIRSHADVVKRLQADGHYISVHSDAHLLYMPWENRDSLLVSKQQFTDDILHAYEALAANGIAKADAPYFIPPYEYYNSTVCSWARQMGRHQRRLHHTQHAKILLKQTAVEQADGMRKAKRA